MKTPYEQHCNAEPSHKEVIYSPNGVDRIHECLQCRLAFMFSPNDEQPITLWNWFGRLKRG